MKAPTYTNFWQFDGSYWLGKLNSGNDGLSSKEATRLLRLYQNKKRKISSFEKDITLFLGQFKSPLMLLLIGAVILSAFLGDTSDVFIILFIVLSTGLLSFFQERTASRIVEKLQSLITLKCTVIRNGKSITVASDKVVPGDLLLFTAGNRIPADCVLLEANELYVNESSLTGESYPVRKETAAVNENSELTKRTNCLWEGTNIVSGHAKAVVIHTGTDTVFGSLAQSAATTVETTFEKGIRDFGYFLMKITLFLSIFILTVNLINKKSVIESALFALALAVGMAPELLPAITTIAMSAGAKRLLEQKVIVKKLASIQNLGEIDLLCTDKTGTITEGVIEIAGLVNGEEKEDAFVKQLAYWNAIYETGYANPIDEALKQLQFKEVPTATKLGEVPYDFIRKRLSIAVSTTDGDLMVSKGAFKEMMSICSTIRTNEGTVVPLADYQSKLEEQFKQYGEKGMRVLAVGYKSMAKETITKDSEIAVTFAGFILMQDPVKEGITETIQKLKELGVKLKIITGDNRNVAQSIALAIGIQNPVIITGEDLITTSPEALHAIVKKTHIFAEVEPQQKERIIQALRKAYTVAYMGDGINDVAAINAADVGISVDNAVDIAKEAADFVLMEKNLMVLTDGITEGRKTFANTLKYIFINTGSTFGNMFSVAIASLLLPFLPMLPKQILLTNFITDFPYLMIASDKVDTEQLDKPGRWNLKFIRNYMIVFGIHSSLFDLITFLTLLYVLKVKESTFQTGWFVESIVTELFILFIIRTRKNFFKSMPGKYLFILSVLGLVLTLGLPYLPFAGELGLTPLSFKQLTVMLLIVTAYIFTADLLKVWFFKKYKRDL